MLAQSAHVTLSTHREEAALRGLPGASRGSCAWRSLHSCPGSPRHRSFLLGTCSLPQSPTRQCDQLVRNYLLSSYSVLPITFRIKSPHFTERDLDSAYSHLPFAYLARLASAIFQLRGFAHALPASLPGSGWLFFSLKFSLIDVTSAKRLAPTASAECGHSFPLLFIVNLLFVLCLLFVHLSSPLVCKLHEGSSVLFMVAP